ncbi:hypothetical protein [Klebsiella variicola]|uniref:hypothetical protein n=1 Tax=Klebsiella variicola TaxID=244366 RepID=UPI00396C9218
MKGSPSGLRALTSISIKKQVSVSVVLAVIGCYSTAFARCLPAMINLVPGKLPRSSWSP